MSKPTRQSSANGDFGYDVLKQLRGGLVVSCQAYPGDPLREPDVTARMALSVIAGGAVGVRVQGVGDLEAVRNVVSAPMIGLWKDGDSGVFITPTLRHAEAVQAAGADIVAVDGTRRERPDGRTLAQTIRELKQRGPTLVMADCGDLEDALAAAEAGADVIGTTLAGYSGTRPATVGPDLELVTDIRAQLPGAWLMAEGRIHTPEQAHQALAAGADSVTVGTAITHPASITSWFVDAVRLPKE